jgi:hypothetical protein
MTLVSDIKLIRTDTTLDLSQKAEKGIPQKTATLPLCIPLASHLCLKVWGKRTTCSRIGSLSCARINLHHSWLVAGSLAKRFKDVETYGSLVSNELLYCKMDPDNKLQSSSNDMTKHLEMINLMKNCDHESISWNVFPNSHCCQIINQACACFILCQHYAQISTYLFLLGWHNLHIPDVMKAHYHADHAVALQRSTSMSLIF